MIIQTKERFHVGGVVQPIQELRCSECDQEVAVVIEVGQEPAENSCTAWLCPGCLERAYNLSFQITSLEERDDAAAASG